VKKFYVCASVGVLLNKKFSFVDIALRFTVAYQNIDPLSMTGYSVVAMELV